ncbi:MAG: 30S ribosomal protein S7 [Candidatus Lokiarchaeota archaeon]|nr:30S ribosomal protein S7 [Candidatus Lokiarchaeota archaeon]
MTPATEAPKEGALDSETPKTEPSPAPTPAAPESPAEPAPASLEPVDVEEEEGPVIEEFETVTGTNILLFGRWPMNVTIHDKGLQRYMNLRDIGVPHMSGLYQQKRFWKHKQSIVERLATRMMTPGTIRARIKGKRTSCRSGKKQKVLNIIRRSFELINLKTGENPVQVLVNAIEHASLREDTTRISMGGISYQSSVDVAPARRVDYAIHLLALGASRRSHNSPVTIEECLTEEILAAAKGDSSSFAVARKEEKERISFSAR